ncbi:hypothetical protein EXU57_24130 [Segetibacter sp. 3557_3]|uniref:non-homologous end-joining DNA ligase LigD n=1 Tax=Segetibacter sp. 3557_3 TaxID=2547429 RepID=UPI001058FDC8|nr:hypothetical protein [Segetibacter sp. 3557_3]TDH18270.1 hypothetical protein EXU57_24130 [Segetibacter sp. 3557_3]
MPLTEKEEVKVIKEKKEAPVKSAQTTNKPIATAATTMADSNWPELEAQQITTEEVFTIEGKDLSLTNVERQLWKGVTKSDLIIYYHNIAEYILPYLKDRPQSLHIKHNGPGAPGMYIKDMEGRQPQWAELFSTPRKHKKKGKRDQIDYLVCNDEATLLYMANLGCIDINPWTSRTHNYQQPDYIIIDLDPSDEDFKKAITTAQAAKQVFDKLKLKAYPKTSGKTGLHLYIPCEGFSFPQARKIAEHICEQVHLLFPDITTTQVTVSKRGDKLYIDPNQNDEADTVAALLQPIV